MRLRIAAALLALVLVSGPRFALAHDGPHAAEPEPEPDSTVVMGLSATQLGTAAGVGAWLGVGAALTARGAAVGTGMGLLATIYVAHLVVEAVVVGGVYFFWPAEEPEEAVAVVTPTAATLPRIGGLQLAAGTRHASH